MRCRLFFEGGDSEPPYFIQSKPNELNRTRGLRCRLVKIGVARCARWNRGVTRAANEGWSCVSGLTAKRVIVNPLCLGFRLSKIREVERYRVSGVTGEQKTGWAFNSSDMV